MNDLSGARVLVVGAGVLGLAVALEAAARGGRCTVLDPAPLEEGASGVAAGMLAPAFESALDPICAGRFPLLRDARDLWPAFCARHGLPEAERSGAMWLDPSGLRSPDDVAAALVQEGARAEVLTPARARSLAPGLAVPETGAVFTPDDWRLDPLPMLHALRAAFLASGGEVRASPVASLTERGLRAGEGRVHGDAVVICAGPQATAFAAAAPELSVLRPIKGEILRFDSAQPLAGLTVRSPAGYLAPGSAGALAGATMAEGLVDSEPTAAAARSLRAAAAAMYPHLAAAPATHRAAVRAATPDGLPLAGRSAAGVWIAAGARRNGWLLAPLLGELLAAQLAGDPGSTSAAALRPDRFDA